MKRAALALSPFVLLLVPFVSAHTPETQSGASLWDTLVAPAANSARAAVVENVNIEHCSRRHPHHIGQRDNPVWAPSK